MRTFELYIARNLIQHTVIVFVVLLGLFVFITLIDQLQDIGKNDYGIWDALRFVGLSMPRIIFELFPLVALLGTIMGLSTMSQDSELIVMRASGVSLNQIVLAVSKLGLVYVVLGTLVGELVAPTSETLAQRGRAEALQRDITRQTNYGLWMRDGKSYVNIGEVLPDLSLRQVRIFEFDEDSKLRSLVYAGRGAYETNAWRLDRVRQTLIAPATEGAVSQEVGVAHWHTEVTPDLLSVFLIKPDQLSTWRLFQYISHLRSNDQDTAIYELALWNKLVAPLTTIVMVIVAIPFVFGQIRSASTGRNLFIGIMLGLAFYVIDRGFGYVVLVYGITPFFGAVLPVIAFMGLASYMLKQVR